MITPILLTIAAAILLLLGMQVHKLASMGLLAGDIVATDPREIPTEMIDPLVEAENFLGGQGFTRVHYVTRSPVIQGQPWGLFGALYRHEASNTWALAYVEPMIHPVFAWRLKFITPSGDGGWLATLSGSEFGPQCLPPGYVLRDAMAYAPAQQWACHQELIGQQSRLALPPQPREVLNAFETLYFQGLVETGHAIAAGGKYHLKARTAATAMFSLMFKQRKLYRQKTAATGSAQGATCSGAATVDAQVAAYEAYRNINEGNRARWLSSNSVLLFSILAFAVSFGLSLSLHSVLILVVVLLVHESGHLLGMWLFGYRDLRMMFIPFMGALASGKKEEISNTQEAIILLLGPAPGYMLGVFLLSSGNPDMPEWLVQYATMSLVLNALNLLPFMPLDGGRLVSLALFNRMPRLQLAMNAMSIAALGYAGLAWGEYPALIIAVLLLVAFPHMLTESRLLLHLLSGQLHKGYTGYRQVIDALKAHPAWLSTLPQNRWPLLDSLSYRIQHASAGPATSALVLGLWILTIALPLALFQPLAQSPEEPGAALADRWLEDSALHAGYDADTDIFDGPDFSGEQAP